MKKNELSFRKEFKNAYWDYLTNKSPYNLGRVTAFEEIAELIFPKINIEMSEERWTNQFKKENGYPSIYRREE